MLCIVLHNFFHWANTIGENEFTFENEHIYTLLIHLKNDPGGFINYFFTYFGHFGVQIFIFASGYGLAKQFMNNKPSGYGRYITPKLLKIYVLMVFGLMCYFAILYPFGRINTDIFFSFASSTLLLYNNFSYDTILYYPHSGTWWYFSLIIQLYLIFPLLYNLLNKYKMKGFYISLVGSVILIYVLLPLTESFNFPIFGNFVGHLPEFILGIGLAMFKDIRLKYKTVLPAALIVFILSNFYQYIHPLSFLSATVLIMILLYPLCDKLPKLIEKPIYFIGTISMFMFVINSMVRAYTSIYIYGKSQLYIFVLALIHLSIVIFISYIACIIYKITFSPLLNKAIKAIQKR